METKDVLDIILKMMCKSLHYLNMESFELCSPGVW